MPGKPPIIGRFLAGGAALAALLACGCLTADLSGDARVAAEVAECLPPGTKAPVAVERAVWFPHASGFGSADNSGMGHMTGVVALAGNSLWFMTWDETLHQFDMRRVVEVLPATGVEVVRAGTASMLVIQSRNRSYDGFELMNGGEIGSDSGATQGLCDKIAALRARYPESDP